MELSTIIIAAGSGRRMKSEKSKLIHKIYDKELIKRVYDLASSLGHDIVAVVGYKKDQIMNLLGESVHYAYQEELLGTGHAVMMTEKYFSNKSGKVLVLYGDVPILRKETIEKLIKQSINNNDVATILTAIVDNPLGYGRIIRDLNGEIEEIVEDKDATSEQKRIREVNSGIYCFDIEELFKALKDVKSNNAQNEYYLTDVIKIMKQKGLKIGTSLCLDSDEILGINDKYQLEYVTNCLKLRINKKHMLDGVVLIDKNNTYIYDDVQIGVDTVIYPNVTLKGKTSIGENCTIGPNSYINNCIIGDNTIVKPGEVLENVEK